MQPRKLDLFIATYPYGGNGGFSSEHPDVRNWLITTMAKVQSDPRIGRVSLKDFSDTPITMTRNRSVVEARNWGADLLLMIDSDMRPDSRLNSDPTARPFWESSFEKIYKHWERGPLVVAAPYRGPGPVRPCYMFRWRNSGGQYPSGCEAALQMFTCEEAAERAGFEEVAAMPTGLILWDMRCFDLTEPKKPDDRPWFYYEWKDLYESEKASTEDVSATRDVSMAGIIHMGYNPLICNWDAWAGHHKPECVDKPVVMTADALTGKLADAARNRLPSDERVMVLKSDDGEWPAPDLDLEDPRMVTNDSDFTESLRQVIEKSSSEWMTPAQIDALAESLTEVSGQVAWDKLSAYVAWRSEQDKRYRAAEALKPEVNGDYYADMGQVSSYQPFDFAEIVSSNGHQPCMGTD